jgi:predicted amidohydrolase
MKVALAQLNIAWEDKETNFRRAELLIQTAAREGCDIVVLPEMFSTGCSNDIAKIAEDEGGTTDRFLAQRAKEFSIAVIAGFPLKAAGTDKAKNAAAVYDAHGSLLARFVKLHPFSLAGEDRFFIPGEAPVTFTVAGVPSSVFICYDLRFPEVFRSVAQDIQAVFVIANWPASRILHWETLLRARAIENQCFVIGVNRTGSDGKGILYPGASCVFDPFGNELCRGDDSEECFFTVIDPEEVGRIRNQLPFLKDIQHV